MGSITASGFSLVSPTFVGFAGQGPPASYRLLARLRIEFTDGLGVPAFVAQSVPEPAAGLLILAGLGGLRIARGS